MTKKEKERKIKLICLIMMCNYVKAQKQPPKNIVETLQFAFENINWMNELKRVVAQPLPRHPKGGIAFVNGDRPEVIQRKDGTIIDLQL